MPCPKGKWQHAANRPCNVCQYPDRGQIDHLIATADGSSGSGRRALAERFGISESSIYNHGKNHVTAEYRQAGLIGLSAGRLRRAYLKKI